MADTENKAVENEVPDDGVSDAAKRWVWTDEDIIDRDVIGTVVWFSMRRGYGFVSRDDGQGDDIFVHRSLILAPNPDHIIASLAEKEHVKFDTVAYKQGVAAVNVRPAPDTERTHVLGLHFSPHKGIRTAPKWACHLIPAIDQPTRCYGQLRVFSGVEQNAEGRPRRMYDLVEKWSDEDIVEHDVCGKVKWFKLEQGYGFISRIENENDENPDEDNRENDFFVHRTSIMQPSPRHIIESLAPEEKVNFDIVRIAGDKESAHQFQAVNVTALGGTAVRGHRHAPRLYDEDVPQWAIDVLCGSRHKPNTNGDGKGKIDGAAKTAPKKRKTRSRQHKNAEKNGIESAIDGEKNADGTEHASRRNNQRQRRQTKASRRYDNKDNEERTDDNAEGDKAASGKNKDKRTARGVGGHPRASRRRSHHEHLQRNNGATGDEGDGTDIQQQKRSSSEHAVPDANRASGASKKKPVAKARRGSEKGASDQVVPGTGDQQKKTESSDDAPSAGKNPKKNNKKKNKASSSQKAAGADGAVAGNNMPSRRARASDASSGAASEEEEFKDAHNTMQSVPRAGKVTPLSMHEKTTLVQDTDANCNNNTTKAASAVQQHKAAIDARTINSSPMKIMRHTEFRHEYHNTTKARETAAAQSPTPEEVNTSSK